MCHIAQVGIAGFLARVTADLEPEPQILVNPNHRCIRKRRYA